MPTGARLARTSDVDDIAGIQMRAWRSAFADLLDPQTLADLRREELADQWADAVLRP